MFQLSHHQKRTRIKISIGLDARTEFIYDSAVKCLEKLTGNSSTSDKFIDEAVLHSVFIAFWKSLLEKPIGLLVTSFTSAKGVIWLMFCSHLAAPE
jgi:hypothetical protein